MKTQVTMKILGVGLSGVVLETSPTECIKVQPSKFSEYSYRQETRLGLLSILRELDPEQTMFVYGKACRMPRIPHRYEVYGIHVHKVLQRHKAKEPEELAMSFRRAVKFPKMQPAGDLTAEDIQFLCEAMDKLHSRGWAHNDLSLNNIMRGADGKPRIIDWGEAEKSWNADADQAALNSF